MIVRACKRMRTTIYFAVSSALSLLGNSVASVILPLVLLARTGDALAAGTLALCVAIPQVICGILGGAALDRVNRRAVSIISDIVSALCVMALPLIDMTMGLSFGWFVLFGILGAVGDVPGMTARDALLPAVTARDGISLERYMGLNASIEALVTVVGPALAAGLIALGGDVNALWVTGALSLLAALATCGIPRAVGAIGATGENDAGFRSASSDIDCGFTGLLRIGVTSLCDGVHILFRNDGQLCVSVLLALGVTAVVDGYQGIVLPAYFSSEDSQAMLGVVLSVLSVGMLAGSLLYTAVGPRLSRRVWYVVSLIGMFLGIAMLGSLASAPCILAGALLSGFAAGPVSALLNFIVFDRVPAQRRGAALGTQNTLCLVVGPAAVFVASLLIEVLSVHLASLALLGVWGVVTAIALFGRAMREL